MSGLYNMIMGVNKATPYVLAVAGLDAEKAEALGRFRDCWITPDASKVMILHRNYAANGDQGLLDEVATWPNFSSHRSTTDETYAIFEFVVPTDMAPLAKKLAEVTDTSDRWGGYMKVIMDLQAGKITAHTEKAVAAGRKIFDQIESGKSGVVETEDGAVNIDVHLPSGDS